MVLQPEVLRQLRNEGDEPRPLLIQFCQDLAFPELFQLHIASHHFLEGNYSLHGDPDLDSDELLAPHRLQEVHHYRSRFVQQRLPIDFSQSVQEPH